MNNLTAYYRALINYRQVTSNNRQCANLCNALAEADSKNDSLAVIQNTCIVDEDWLNAIEKGLVFIEKAIKEDRQFIDSNGEVLPIEKVKNITKESVNHLSKHSNLITTPPQDNDTIIPDMLYSVERFNDFAVYENRFLYMLLCYLRDFVTVRYNAIFNLSNKYEGTLKLEKKVSLQHRKLTYQVELHDEQFDDEYIKATNPSNTAIERIDNILNTIIALLGTSLMEYASREAMLRPPITRTNVLKMDVNFKGAVELYDYILAYDKPGYTIKTHSTQLAPFPPDLANELSEVGALLAFLVYEYGLDLNSILNEKYEAEEEKSRADAIIQRQVVLTELKSRLENMDCTPEEYILRLEEQINAVQSEFTHISNLRTTVNELTSTNRELSAMLKSAKLEINDLTTELESISDKHNNDINNIKNDNYNRINDMINRHNAELSSMEAQYNERINDVKNQMQTITEKLNSDINTVNIALSENIAKLNILNIEYEKLLEEKRLCQARLTSIRLLNKEKFNDDDYTDQESFTELENEYKAFSKFYNERWSIAKSKIRKKLLNFQALKGHNKR